MSLGMPRKVAFSITGVTRHQLYHKPSNNPVGRKASKLTLKKDLSTGLVYEVLNEEVVKTIISIKEDPDQADWYKLICYTLKVKGYYINHKKVYRLMSDYHLLEVAKRKKGRNFVKFRRVTPSAPLEILEMDIKYVWIEDRGKYGYILTVIDTFTRYVLAWRVGASMREAQVKQVWDQIIIEYLQPANLLEKKIDIEVRNDNGRQFASKMIQAYFQANHLNQVFTHPYTPEENAHVERFHRTLGKSLKKESFKDLKQVQIRLERFYKTYNNNRQHGSIAMLSPSMFWALFEDNQIKVTQLPKKRLKFSLKIAYQDVLNWKDINRYHYREMKT